MRHFIAYHNPERMGYPYRASPHHFFYTKKPVSHLVGNTVWVVSFAGTQRDYALVGCFQVTEAGDATEGGFKHSVAGNGPTFRPWIRVKDRVWFPRLLQVTGNFGLGLSEVKDRSVIEGLIEAAAEAGYSLESA